MQHITRRSAATTIFLLSATAAQAAFPDRVVRLVVPFPAGGATDILARLLAQKLTEAWGQQVVVDNRSGASGAIGAGSVARSASDGYTVMVGTSATHAMAQSLIQQLPYNVVSDFTPIAPFSQGAYVLVTHPGIAATSIAELIRLGKAQPGSLSFGSSGNGSQQHLIGEQFKRLTGADYLHVPYRGSAPAQADLLSGSISMMFNLISEALPAIKAGTLRPLGVSSPARSRALPEVPTLAEGGVPLEAVAWFALFGPARLPSAIAEKINADVGAAMRQPDVIARLDDLSLEPMSMSTAEFAQFQAREVESWAAVVTASGVRLD